MRYVWTFVGALGLSAPLSFAAGRDLAFEVGALARNLPGLVRDQAERVWDPRHSPEVELRDRTLGIVGYGSIGRELARIASAFGMRILAVKRNVGAMDDGDYLPVFEGDPAGRLPERVFGTGELKAMLGEADFAVVLAPLTRDTAGLVGEAELRVMKATSYLINVARGSVVDLAALARALREGWIAGAAVDVFDPEPLSPASDVWTVPNLLVTPHVMASRANPRYDERCNRIFGENLRRYLAGRPLMNLVRRETGY